MELVTLEVLFMIFFGAIVTDFITGVLVAAKQGKLKSRTCSNGMFRSIGECIVLVIFILIERLVPGLSLILSTFVMGFVFKEAFNIIEELLKAGKIDNCEDKLKFFLLTGQLSKEQINAISEIGVSTIPNL